MSNPATGESRHKNSGRITHWINVLCFIAFAVSGVGILLAHPRFYWAEIPGSPSSTAWALYSRHFQLTFIPSRTLSLVCDWSGPIHTSCGKNTGLS